MSCMICGTPTTYRGVECGPAYVCSPCCDKARSYDTLMAAAQSFCRVLSSFPPTDEDISHLQKLVKLEEARPLCEKCGQRVYPVPFTDEDVKREDEALKQMEGTKQERESLRIALREAEAVLCDFVEPGDDVTATLEHIREVLAKGGTP